MVYRSIKWHSVAWNSSTWCWMAQHNNRSSITSCGTAKQELVRQNMKRFSQPRNSWQSRVMAERDMNQQSVTLAKVRRNHQKYKTQMEQPKVKWNSDLLGAWRHNFWQLPSEAEYDITFDLARNFRVKMLRLNPFASSQLAWSYSSKYSYSTVSRIFFIVIRCL